MPQTGARCATAHISQSARPASALPSGESVVSVSRLTETCVSHQDSGAVSRGCRLGPFDLIGAFFFFFRDRAFQDRQPPLP